MKAALPLLRAQAAAFQGRAMIVGKGPSFNEFDALAARRDRFMVGLNETALRAACHAAFIIDEDILDKQGDQLALLDLAAVFVPRVPHRPKNVGRLALYLPNESAVPNQPWEQTLGDRVFRFNLGTSPPSEPLGEVIPGYNFSAPTLAHLLAVAGFTDIQLAGVDGGTRYAQDFQAFEYKKLKSVQNSFDVQFDDLRKIRDRFNVQFSSVRCPEAFVLIGAEPEQCLATEVLKWSIESSTFMAVRFLEPDHRSRDLYSTGQAGTPFSFQRLFLPQLAGNRGRGVYFDSDMLVMRDIYELFNWDMGSNLLMSCQPTPGRDAQHSVFLVDNRRASWNAGMLIEDFRSGRLSYNQIIRDFSFAQPLARTLPADWNSLEIFEYGRTSNLHYTDMSTQPWLSLFSRHADLWCEALIAAAKARVSVREALDRSNAMGWVRPSLQWQVEHDHPNPWTLPRRAKRLDQDWLPPHELARSSSAPLRLKLYRWRLGAQVRRLMQSRTYYLVRVLGNGLRKIL